MNYHLRTGVFAVGLIAGALGAQPTTRPGKSDSSARVVFVCEHGTVKSLVAVEYFNRLARARGLHAVAISRGTKPDTTIPSLVRMGLETDGFDVSAFHPRRFTYADVTPGILVVALDADVESVSGNTTAITRWDGLPSVMADYAGGRNAIVARVRQLVDSLARATATLAPPTCMATPTSMTPTGWSGPVRPALPAPKTGLKLVGEVVLPGPASRFDYQSVDPTTGRIYMNHMNAGRTVVFNADSGRVITEINGVPRATGVLAIPSHHQVYVSAAGSHDVAIIDDRTLAIASRVGGMRFPDGIAFAPEVDKVFVSDESGDADVVIDAKTGSKRSTIELGGEAGNTHYDSVSHCILVAVQTKNEMVAIDPVTERVVQRYDLPGSDHPHGFTIDQEGRLAFISCEGNAALLVVDLRTMKVVQTIKVADGPDVLAWDAGWRRLYVSGEGGALQAFWLDGATLRPAGEVRAPHAHTVSVDPRTHKVYLPLENIDGRPVLRIFLPAS
jgi:DNA-binding beta-propeller fold protein YncE/protein-tyrosine-phosphatase